jgi:hypothetical protein
MGGDASGDLSLIKWLGNIIDGAGLKTGHLSVDVIDICRDKDYWHVLYGWISLKMATNLKAIHAGKQNIKQDQIWDKQFGSLNASFTILGDKHIKWLI